MTFRRRLSTWLSRFSGRSDRRRLEEFSRSLALIVDREALEASLAARLRELFDPERLLILEPDPSSGQFLPGFYFGIPEPMLAGLRIAPRGKLARWLTANETCLVVGRQAEVLEYLDPAERALFGDLGLAVAVPMLSLNRLAGILLLGSSRQGWGIRRGQLGLLYLLASQASLAFENAGLYRAQRERLDRLYRAERLAAVGQLAAGVAHEIRNPLTAIRSTMQYLLSALDPAESRYQLVAEILSEVDRINHTVGGLLSLSRSGEGRKERLDLAAPLDGAIHLVHANANDGGVQIQQQTVSSLWVRGDAGHLKQVFLNLLINALQSMPQGGVIDVTSQPRTITADGRELRWAEVRIVDQGGGIAPDQLRKIFDPFFTTKHDGTGLGLPICHGILEQHEGEIHIESELGQGTIVTVRLPLFEGPATWPTS